MATQAILDFYRHPAGFTLAKDEGRLFDDAPAGIGSLARMVQTLMLHQHIASTYGVALPAERQMESQNRSVDGILSAILAQDSRPLAAERSPEKRGVGVCSHFTVFAVSLLRARGIPSRARCGFASYFAAGKFLDHWLCEYWNAEAARWIMVDTQLDEHQRKLFKTDIDPLDVPRDHFLVAGDAWAQCREGTLDPERFGIFDEHGLWFIAGNLIRDLAALNNREMLPWDVWGAMPKPDEEIGREHLELFDRVAAVTRHPDHSFEELKKLYHDDARLGVPAVVFNAILRRSEPVS
jgi:hypothetical protein